jgi:hypothetical protein
MTTPTQIAAQLARNLPSPAILTRQWRARLFVREQRQSVIQGTYFASVRHLPPTIYGGPREAR